MRKNKWILAAVGFLLAASLAGCTGRTKEAGPHKIILELADPNDARESEPETDGAGEAAETVTEPETGADSAAETRAAQIMGLSKDIRLEYTKIASDDPVVALATKKLLPDGTALSDFSFSDIQANEGDSDTKVVPAGTVTFTLNVPEENALVLLYHLNEKGQVVETELLAENGTVSYDTEDCGHWIVLDETVQDPETESAFESEPETAAQ